MNSCFLCYVLMAVILAVVIAVSVALARGSTPVHVTASWYGDAYRGKTMANGQPFDPDGLTCASWEYPLGTKLRVTSGRKSVVVLVTDRGPATHLLASRQLDLSYAAFRQIADPALGLIRVQLVDLGR